MARSKLGQCCSVTARETFFRRGNWRRRNSKDRINVVVVALGASKARRNSSTPMVEAREEEEEPPARDQRKMRETKEIG